MARIPLARGTETPEMAVVTLAAFGRNPHGEPNYRLIWSTRKRYWFDGMLIPEYEQLVVECWVLEAWLPALKFAGPRAAWTKMHTAAMGPYPTSGEYGFVMAFPSDWYPNEWSLQALAAGLEASREIPVEKRADAIRERLQFEEQQEKKRTIEAMQELQDSASMGRIQQPASGQKNVFRTPEDFERDAERAPVMVTDSLPKRGGKLVE